jgi:hypothetical protein
LAAVLAFLGSGRLQAQCQVAKHVGNNTATNDRYGIVAVDGATMVVGALNHGNTNGGNDGYGAAYVFEFDSTDWNQVAKLLPADIEEDDEFGVSVAIHGDTIVVGSVRDDDGGSNTGSAYVFIKPDGGWTDDTPHAAKLTASDPTGGDNFGVTVAIDCDTIAAGAVNHAGTGAVYVFQRPATGWATGTETAKLTASDGGAGHLFGRGLAIDGDTIVAGAEVLGAAYVFVRPSGCWTSGTETARLSDSDNPERFGYGLDVHGRLVVVGAHLDDVDGVADAGSAYVYVRPTGGWVSATEAAAKLTASIAGEGDNLGLSVSILGEGTVLVGTEANTSRTSPGYVCMYKAPAGEWSDMTEWVRIEADDGSAGDQFGTSIDTSCDTLVVGANRDDDDDHGVDSGSAYVFAGVSGTDYNGDGMPDVCGKSCPSDFNDDGAVDIVDFLKLLGNWGACP